MARDEPVNLISIQKELVDALIRICLEALPRQAYGLVGGRDVYHPSNLYPCSTNLRNTPEWRPVFESLGEFYRDPDRGFVIAPEELLTIWNQMRERGESFAGVFHSHRWHGPVPTKADLKLHGDPDILSYIVSVAGPNRPALKIYRLHETQYESMPYEVI
jgi:proteasome lid subunit RPN8/RPN11